MAKNLTVNQTLTNGTRWRIDKVKIDDEEDRTITFTFSMRTATNGTPADGEVSSQVVAIRGPKSGSASANSDTVFRRVLPSGGRISDIVGLNYSVKATDETQFQAAVTAAKGSKATFETFLQDNGYVDVSLAGT